MKRNLVGKILGKIKIFVQDFVPIRTALTVHEEGFRYILSVGLDVFIYFSKDSVRCQTFLFLSYIFPAQQTTTNIIEGLATVQSSFFGLATIHTSDNSRVNSVVLYNSREWKYHHSVVLYNSPEWKVLPLSCVV